MKRCAMLMARLGVLVALSGCGHFRFSAVPEVPPKGDEIETRNRYRLADLNYLIRSGELREADMEAVKRMQTVFVQTQNSVFAEDGVCLKLVFRGEVSSDTSYQWSVFVPFMCSLAFLPAWMRIDKTYEYEVRIAGVELNPEDGRLRVSTEKSYSRSNFTPLSLLFHYGRPNTSKKYYYRTGTYHLDEMKYVSAEDRELQDKAVAYGVAVRLKELEDRGIIQPALAVPLKIDAANLPL